MINKLTRILELIEEIEGLVPTQTITPDFEVFILENLERLHLKTRAELIKQERRLLEERILPNAKSD